MANRNRDQDIGAASVFTVLGLGLSVTGGIVLFSGLRDRKIADLLQKMLPTKLSEIPSQLEKSDTVYVKISGRVNTNATPIAAKNSSIKGVIYKYQLNGAWYSLGNLPGQPPSANDQFTKRENIKTVPFFIQDNSSTKVFVKAIGPTEPNLDVVSYREERAVLSLVLGMFGLKFPYKYIHQEFLLPINKELLVVGNVVKSEDGTYHVVSPKKGWFSPYIVTEKSEEKLISELEQSGGKKILSGSIVTAFGVASLVGGIGSFYQLQN